MAQRAGRMFEVAKGFEDADINLPSRSTAFSAGYDFEAAEDVTIKPIWGVLAIEIGRALGLVSNESREENQKSFLKPTLVKTGVKAFMQEDEVLYLYNRSSNPLKRFLLLGNGVGVIDSDYYGNPDNDGHIMFQFINFGLFPVTIRKGEKVGQGIFSKFLKTSYDVPGGTRTGGHGSTGK